MKLSDPQRRALEAVIANAPFAVGLRARNGRLQVLRRLSKIGFVTSSATYGWNVTAAGHIALSHSAGTKP